MLYRFHVIDNVRKMEKTRRKRKKAGKIRVTSGEERSWAESWEKDLEERDVGKEKSARQRGMRRLRGQRLRACRSEDSGVCVAHVCLPSIPLSCGALSAVTRL